jgi:AhpC/TSA family
MISSGETAPDFELPDQDGEPIRLSSLRGRPVVLYVYPKADHASGPVRRARAGTSLLPSDRPSPDQDKDCRARTAGEISLSL